MLIFGISWAMNFGGSCPEPSPDRLPENFAAQRRNYVKLRYYPLLGIPFAFPMDKSKFYLDIDINNYKLYSLHLNIYFLKYFTLYLRKMPLLHTHLIQQKDDTDHIFLINSTAHFLNGESPVVQETDCNSWDDEVRLWYDNEFLLFWSCKDGELFYDEALLVIELKQVDIENLDEYKNRLFDLKTVAKKFISPQLMEYINWEPERSVTAIPESDCKIIQKENTNYSLLLYNLNLQSTPSKNLQNVTPTVELLSFPVFIIVVVTVLVLIIIATLVVLKNSNVVYPTLNY